MTRKALAAGDVFGRLTCLEPRHDKQRSSYKGLYSCSCGGQVVAFNNSVRSGNTSSCGCRNREVAAVRVIARNTTHGLSNTKEYDAWYHMKRRCTNINVHNYHNYGGRGISVCEEWMQSFETFLADMGFAPSPQHSIDRINNDGNYEPHNCRWATASEQINNRRPRKQA